MSGGKGKRWPGGVGTTALVLLMLLVAATTARAELKGESAIDYTDMSLEELLEVDVVYGASKYQQKTSEAPASVTVITSEDILAYGWRTLADLLNSLRGFYVTYDRNYHYVGVRGFGRPGDYNSRLLVLIDGIRFNENVYGSAALGSDFPLDLDLIERIEVVRGPSSSLYGAHAVFGVLNIVTKQAHQVDGVQVAGHVGSYSTYGGRLTAGKAAESSVNWLVSGSLGQSDGQDHYFPEFEDPATNNGVFVDGDGEERQQVFAKLGFGGWRLEGLFSARRKNVPTAPWGTIFNDNRTQTDDDWGMITGGYRGEVGATTEIAGDLSYGYYEYQGAWAYDYADPGDPPFPVVSMDDARGRWLDANLAATQRLGEHHRLVGGFDYRDNLRQDQNVWDHDPYWSYLADRRTSENWGAYLQAELRAAAWLLANVGLRYDHYSTFGGTTHPRLALVAEVADGSIVKVLYGSAFRAPNAYELYYNDDSVTSKSNPALDPETMRTYELIYEQRLATGLQGTLAGFWYENKDLIEQTIDPADDLLVYVNGDVIESYGFEAELDGRFENGLRGRASYSYQRATDGADGSLLTNSPRHLAKLNVAVPISRPRTTLGCEALYGSSRRTYAGGLTDDSLQVNLNLVHRSLHGGIELRGGVYNLFNAPLGHPAGLEHTQDILAQDGRSYRLTLVLSH